ncbi:hypothetical protein, conserved [Eimeria maxima]|uniref:Uncharacterized protein n=1 Tax=Eimeria maxima TaxID=5804 RepID=U6MAV5_EIMMA|nr:hypothetical protein, conserved [Eimeria maxima]CDJ61352.1 hypothetical protein, conserved [Eimeria maxima]
MLQAKLHARQQQQLLQQQIGHLQLRDALLLLIEALHSIRVLSHLETLPAAAAAAAEQETAAAAAAAADFSCCSKGRHLLVHAADISVADILLYAHLSVLLQIPKGAAPWKRKRQQQQQQQQQEKQQQQQQEKQQQDEVSKIGEVGSSEERLPQTEQPAAAAAPTAAATAAAAADSDLQLEVDSLDSSDADDLLLLQQLQQQLHWAKLYVQLFEQHLSIHNRRAAAAAATAAAEGTDAAADEQQQQQQQPIPMYASSYTYRICRCPPGSKKTCRCSRTPSSSSSSSSSNASSSSSSYDVKVQTQEFVLLAATAAAVAAGFLLHRMGALQGLRRLF